MSTALAAARAKTAGKRMLRDALEGYGEDAHSLAEWNALMWQAERDGSWRWKARDASATVAAVKSRVQKDAAQDELGRKFATDLDAVMATELHRLGNADEPHHSYVDPNQCMWRERIGGKQYGCTNELPPVKAKAGTEASQTAAMAKQRRCKWHARECVYRDHPMEKSRMIEIPNDQGFCLSCYEATALRDRGTLQKTPVRLPATKLPGVSEVNVKLSVVQRERLSKRGRIATHKDDGEADGHLSRRLTAQSVCAWGKEDSENAYMWQCRNVVVMHPTLRGAFLPFCGYHAPRCIQDYGAVRKKSTAPCPPIDRRNPFGMCRNHVEAQLSALPFEARAICRFADSEFDVPGIVECRDDQLKPKPKRHPLAPKTAPPPIARSDSINNDHDLDRFAVVKAQTNPSRWERILRQYSTAHQAVAMTLKTTLATVVAGLLSHPNPVSALVKEALWQLQFLRRAGVVATRIQRIYRGNLARRHVRAMGWEHAALCRMRACLTIQRLARGFLGRLAFAQEAEAVAAAVPNIQRIVRGGLSRQRCRRLRAALCVQRNFRAYRRRCLAWAMREEIEYMRALQRQADAHYDEMLVQLESFRRVRARRVLRAHVARWRRRQEEQQRLALERLQTLLSTVKIQRAFRRHQDYKHLKLRYASAQRIQKRVRGWLTRHMWKGDPGVLWTTSFVRAGSGFECGKGVVLAQRSGSYAVPSRKIRMECGARAIQRAYRGFVGRLAANMQWMAMLKRWEWLSLDSGGASTDSMTLGHERYGFLLPSHSYHRDKTRHMVPIKRAIKPDRGFAYKYQNIFELIQDRDGKRAWSLAQEEKWKRAQEKVRVPAKPLLLDAQRDVRRLVRTELVAEKAVAMAQALFPVGCLVLVASTNRRDCQRFHKARVTAVHSDPARESNASTVDVAYISSFLSVRGVRMYNEPRVSITRLRPVGRLTRAEEALTRRPRRPVGELIRGTILKLKLDIQTSQEKRWGSHDVATEEPAPRVSSDLDALADQLRDEDPRADLLIDQRDFVNFAFQNSTVLRAKWLQVVDHVRYGTRDKPLPGLASSSDSPGRLRPSVPLTPSLLSFYQEFGFASVETTKQTVPMPTRAREIEQRLAQLGFQHEPSANVKDDPRPNSLRPQTTSLAVTVGDSNARAKLHISEDDSALAAAAAAAAASSSAQDLHQLIYELKTLPRARHREKILEVTARRARSFVCGFPACGRCFSSHEAARLHQEGVHLHQRRLATATPLVDQFMHAYWPPTSPWNQELHPSFAPSVGYFRCSHGECLDSSDGQFRTRRELQRHVLQVHQLSTAIPSTQVSKGEAQTKIEPKSKPVPDQRSEPAAVSSLIWLGAYSLCQQNLEKKIEGFPRAAAWHGSDIVQCEAHPLAQADPERCRECLLRTRRLVLPCRLYRTVALPGARVMHPTHQQQRQQEEDVGASADDLAGFAIFSVDDPLLCPVVRQHDLIALDESERDRTKRLVRRHATRNAKPHDVQAAAATGAATTLVQLRIQLLCRDANGVSWAIGHIFQPAIAQPQASQPRSESPATVDNYEVTLDDAHVVAVALEDVRAACVVHRCARHVFQRKHFRPDDPFEMRRLVEPRTASHSTGHHQERARRLYVTIERFWRGGGGEIGDENKSEDV